MGLELGVDSIENIELLLRARRLVLVRMKQLSQFPVGPPQLNVRAAWSDFHELIVLANIGWHLKRLLVINLLIISLTPIYFLLLFWTTLDFSRIIKNLSSISALSLIFVQSTQSD